MRCSHVVLKEIVDSTTLANEITTAYSSVLDVRLFEHLSIQAISDSNAPAGQTFTAAVNDTCTATAHGFTTGLKVQCTTTTTLPAGLSLATDYFVVVLTADTFKLATSLANALAGTPVVDITDTGSGTHTITPVALAGATLVLQKSNDPNAISPDATVAAAAAWTDVGTPDSITADETNWYEVTNALYSFARLKFTCTAGRVSTTLNIVLRG